MNEKNPLVKLTNLMNNSNQELEKKIIDIGICLSNHNLRLDLIFTFKNPNTYWTIKVYGESKIMYYKNTEPFLGHLINSLIKWIQRFIIDGKEQLRPMITGKGNLN